MKAKHTLGPWVYDCYGSHDSFCGQNNYIDYTFRVEYSEEMPEEEKAATRDLIGAAPELLDALEKLLADIDGFPDVRPALAAVAKAKGE